MRYIIVIFIVMILSSCTLLDKAASDTYDNIEIKWKPGSWIDDSIHVNPIPFYSIINLDELIDGRDYEFFSNGFRIWMLRTGDILRIEAKFDTTIYILEPCQN